MEYFKSKPVACCFNGQYIRAHFQSLDQDVDAIILPRYEISRVSYANLALVCGYLVLAAEIKTGGGLPDTTTSAPDTTTKAPDTTTTSTTTTTTSTTTTTTSTTAPITTTPSPDGIPKFVLADGDNVCLMVKAQLEFFITYFDVSGFIAGAHPYHVMTEFRFELMLFHTVLPTTHSAHICSLWSVIG